MMNRFCTCGVFQKRPAASHRAVQRRMGKRKRRQQEQQPPQAHARAEARRQAQTKGQGGCSSLGCSCRGSGRGCVRVFCVCARVMYMCVHVCVLCVMCVNVWPSILLRCPCLRAEKPGTAIFALRATRRHSLCRLARVVRAASGQVPGHSVIGQPSCCPIRQQLLRAGTEDAPLRRTDQPILGALLASGFRCVRAFPSRRQLGQRHMLTQSDAGVGLPPAGAIPPRQRRRDSRAAPSSRKCRRLCAHSTALTHRGCWARPGGSAGRGERQGCRHGLRLAPTPALARMCVLCVCVRVCHALRVCETAMQRGMPRACLGHCKQRQHVEGQCAASKRRATQPWQRKSAASWQGACVALTSAQPSAICARHMSAAQRLCQSASALQPGSSPPAALATRSPPRLMATRSRPSCP